ncbi:hypothetical protein Plhal710r2_c023g0095361 [Plasmopara halstedii]
MSLANIEMERGNEHFHTTAFLLFNGGVKYLKAIKSYVTHYPSLKDKYSLKDRSHLSDELKLIATEGLNSLNWPEQRSSH